MSIKRLQNELIQYNKDPSQFYSILPDNKNFLKCG